MNPSALQIMSAGSSAVGLVFAIITCALPSWKVEYISTEYKVEKGLWKQCVIKGTFKVCGTYLEASHFTADLKAARGLTIICILLSILALLIIFACSNITNLIKNEDLKPKVRMGAEIALPVAGLFLLISVIKGIRTERGACIYTGWLGAISLMLAGSLLVWNQRNP